MKGKYMKRILFFLMLIILLGSKSGWCVCTNGSIMFGANGKCYCRQISGTPFLTAQSWCDAHNSEGITRSTIHSVCDYDASDRWQEGSTDCPNMRDYSRIKGTDGTANIQRGNHVVGSLTSDHQAYVVDIQLSKTTVKQVPYDSVAWSLCDVEQSICDEIKASW